MAYGSLVETCACGAPASANGRECATCFRARLGSVSNHYTPSRTLGTNPKAQGVWDRRLESYRSARVEGIQPASTQQRDIDNAKAASDALGTAYRADSTSTMMEAIA